ncbi:MarR family transcriptional regulator [Nocardia sp. NPDC005745]|uniref:MarR family winged helix-turn-helix transcriptional regulator n=1 Tax=Nocardia sp. NPDC005745 TaxID=3157061 RepID=UPI00340A53FF
MQGLSCEFPWAAVHRSADLEGLLVSSSDLNREAAARVAGDIAALGAMRADWERDNRQGLHEMLVASWIVRAQQHLVLRIEALIAPLGLTMTNFECLVVLLASKNGALGMNKMAERLGVHPTSITYAVDSLVKAGLVERKPHPADRRRKLAALTEEGRSVVERALDVLEADRFGIQPLGARELDNLADLLRIAIAPARDDGEVEFDGYSALPPLTHRTRGPAASRI